MYILSDQDVPKSTNILQLQKALKDSFPIFGKVRATQAAAYLGIGVSTFWLYVSQERIKKPVKFGVRVSVWDAEYIREIADNGIPHKLQNAVKG